MANNKKESTAKKKTTGKSSAVTTKKKTNVTKSTTMKKEDAAKVVKKKEVKEPTKKVSTTKKNISKAVNQTKKKESIATKKTTSKTNKDKVLSKKVPKFSTLSNVKVETKKNELVLKNESTTKKKSFITKFASLFKKKTDLKKGTQKQSIKSKEKKLVKKLESKKEKEDKNKKEALFTPKAKKWFVFVTIVCLVVLLLEGIFLIIHKLDVDNNTVYYDSLNSVAIDDTDIVAVGSSNFKYSKSYNYTKGLEKGKLIKYDKNGTIIFEKMYEEGINTTFSSIINVNDGYIVVGSGVFSEEEQTEGAREAFIIKYDREGNIVWEKFYQVLTNTRFNKVIEISDGYIVVGQSIYANMEMGNHTTGGGIIVKYDFNGNEVWHNNHGGMKSGNFNDVVEVNGDLYVVGKDATDSGNIVKYDKDGVYQWHKNYSYTDSIGFTGIAYLDNNLYVVGSKKILPEDITEDDNRDTTNTDALLVVYDLDGNKKQEKTFGGSNYERYNSILAYRDSLYIVGHTTSTDTGFKINTDGELMTGMLVRYDKDGNILKKESFGGSNNDNLTDIVTDSVSIYVSAYSNSSDGNITTAKNNGKDYFGKVIKLDFKFRTLLIK